MFTPDVKWAKHSSGPAHAARDSGRNVDVFDRISRAGWIFNGAWKRSFAKSAASMNRLVVSGLLMRVTRGAVGVRSIGKAAVRISRAFRETNVPFEVLF